MKRSVPLEGIFAPNQAPAADLDARETYTLAYHPIRSLTENPSRAGRFSAVVVRAASVGIISWDTGPSGCSAAKTTPSVPSLA